MVGCKGVWEGVMNFKRCDSPQGGVKCVSVDGEVHDAHGKCIQKL